MRTAIAMLAGAFLLIAGAAVPVTVLGSAPQPHFVPQMPYLMQHGATPAQLAKVPVCKPQAPSRTYSTDFCKVLDASGKVFSLDFSMTGESIAFEPSAQLSASQVQALEQAGNYATLCAAARIVPAPGVPLPTGMTQAQFQQEIRSGGMASACAPSKAAATPSQ